MKDKTYEININASKQHVWNIMLGEDTYPQWVKGFSMDTKFIGKWEEGETVDFIDPGKGGTRAVLDVVDEPNRIVARHIAALSADRKPLEGVENWIGTVEEYVLGEDAGVTTLRVLMHYHVDFEKMLDDGWDKSLKLLKELCEEKS